MTVYAAQSGTFAAVVADMKRPPGMDSATHWLACYVMLSRSRCIDGLNILRAADRKELFSRPPKELLDEIETWLALEKRSHKELVAYMDSLPIDLTEAIVRILSDEAVESEAVEVSRIRAQVSPTASACIPAEEARPQKRLRLRTKTTPHRGPPHIEEEQPKAKNSKDQTMKSIRRLLGLELQQLAWDCLGCH